MSFQIPFASASDEVSSALLALFILLVAAKVGEEICRRIHQPVVVGEILAGVVVGPYALGLVDLDSVVRVFAELGVIFLLFWVGLETKLGDIRSVGKSATQVGVARFIDRRGALHRRGPRRDQCRNHISDLDRTRHPRWRGRTYDPRRSRDR
jgi:hypothetical protein